MPAPLQAYEVLLDFTNDTRDCATVQLLRDYGRSTARIVLLHPGESITLVLDAGSIYRYALKMHSKVADVTARAWRDTHCDISRLFGGAPSSWSPPHSSSPVNGVRVDRVWRDYRFHLWNNT